MVMHQPRLDRVFHALSDPTRRAILESVARSDRPVKFLVDQFTISQPAVTKHLRVLEDAGLITRRQEGRMRYCRIEPDALEATTQWVDRCRRFWNARLDRLEALLNRSTHTRGGSHAGQARR